MTRKLLCPTCGAKYQPHPQDVVEGWQHRVVHITAKRPENLEIQVLTAGQKTIIPVPFLVCDFCNAKIEDGAPAIATTMWRDGDEPERWEKEYSA
jgi:hypothetical protein